MRTTLTSAHPKRPVAMMCNCKQYEDDSDVSPFEQAQRTGNKETVAFVGALPFVVFGWEVFMAGGWSGVATSVIILKSRVLGF